MTDWFTADWHLGHFNIIKYTNRPFSSVSEMDNALINNVNDVVMPDDRLFNLGDVCVRKSNLAAYRARFICQNIFVIPGNHDREKELVKYFKVLPQCYMYENQGFRMVLCHYAMRVWHHSHHGAGMIYGHSHNGLPPIPGVPSFDVGVDCWNYTPISLDDVKREMKRLCALAPNKIGEKDHHKFPGNQPGK